jgi:exopolysaccharide production protein ExoZ
MNFSTTDSVRCKDLNIESPAAQNTYVYGVDLVRFVSAVCVALFHLTWLDERLSTVAWFGWIGVQVFFVISGFVIARSANNTRPAKFIQARVLRLYPTAWACAAIELTILIFTSGLTVGLLMRFVVSLLLYPTGPFLASAYWTLPIEITFYLLIFLVLCVGAFERIERIAIYLAGASVAYIAVYSLQSAGVVDLQGLEFAYGWKNITLLRHGIYFAIGIYMWLWSESRLSRSGAAALSLAVAVAPFEITCRSAEIIALMPVRVDMWMVWPIPVVIWMTCCAMIASAAFWRTEIMHAPSGFLHAARILGLMTYPFYLLHEVLGVATRDVLQTWGLPIIPSVIGATIVIAGVALVIAQVGEPAIRNAMRYGLFKLSTSRPAGEWLQGLFRPSGKS